MISRAPFARCMLILCLLSVWGVGVSNVRADCPLYRLPTNRFGAAMNTRFGLITDYDVASLHIGWYSDWTANTNPLRPGGIEYAQLIWVSEGTYASFGVIAGMVDANPGSLWMIGNEPECTYPPGGGKNTPEQYATAYHDLYTFIKGRDPTAQIAVGGVVQPTPLRLKWLDRVLEHYQTTYGVQMPVDVWNIHNLILQELRGSWGCGIPQGLTEDQGQLYGVDDNDNIEIFKQHIVAMRTWMRDHGEQDKPLIISEYGVLMPTSWYPQFTPARINAFMNATFDYMLTARDPDLGYPADDNLLVQRWSWNSLNDRPLDPLAPGEGGFNGALFVYTDPRFPGVITVFGTNYKAYTDALLLGSASLAGTVSLESRPAAPHPAYVTTLSVTFHPVACPGPDIRGVQTDASGHFTVDSLPPGTYDIVVKGFNTLSNRVEGVQMGQGTTTLNLGLLRSGDANNDDWVTILDFSILAAAYATEAGQPGYDARADFNGDGRVDILDFSLLATHFAECGAEQTPGS